MIYQENVMVGGSWVKASEVTAKKAKIVSETNPTPSQFLNKDGSPKTQDVCKVLLQGDPEPKNLSVNRATLNALIQAFGGDSKNWVGKVLNIETEKVMVAGKRQTALYLVPDGFEKMEDDNGYMVIAKVDGEKKEMPAGYVEPQDDGFATETGQEEDLNVEDIPF